MSILLILEDFIMLHDSIKKSDELLEKFNKGTCTDHEFETKRDELISQGGKALGDGTASEKTE